MESRSHECVGSRRPYAIWHTAGFGSRRSMQEVSQERRSSQPSAGGQGEVAYWSALQRTIVPTPHAGLLLMCCADPGLKPGATLRAPCRGRDRGDETARPESDTPRGSGAEPQGFPMPRKADRCALWQHFQGSRGWGVPPRVPPFRLHPSYVPAAASRLCRFGVSAEVAVCAVGSKEKARARD